MPLALYMDHNVPIAITNGLRIRGVDVITAYDDGRHDLADIDLLDRALALNRVIFTRDQDFLVEASKRQQASTPFCGVIYAHQLRVPIGVCVEQLELIAQAGKREDIFNKVLFLPL